MIFKWLDWIANGFALTATILMAFKVMVLGFVLLLLANILFIIFGYRTKQWSFFCFNLLFGASSILGLVKWSL